MYNKRDNLPPTNQIPLDDDEWRLLQEQLALHHLTKDITSESSDDDVDAEMMTLLLELTDSVPQASTQFQQRLEGQLLQKLNEKDDSSSLVSMSEWERELNDAAALFIKRLVNRVEVKDDILNEQPLATGESAKKSKKVWRLFSPLRVMVAASLIVVLMVTTLTAFPSVAHNLSGYFRQNKTNVLNERTEIPSSEASSYFSHELPSVDETRRPLTDGEMESLANYILRVPDMPGAPTTINTIEEETQTLTQTYIVPKERSPHGNITIRFSQTPFEFYKPPTIGASAIVREVSVGEIPANYVQGYYEMRSATWDNVVPIANQQLIQPAETAAVRMAAQDSILVVDVESVWIDDPTHQRLVWGEGGMVYTLEGSWDGGTLNLLELAEQIILDQPIFQRDVSGLPIGLPDEYELWFENVTYYDEREAVIYEYRDDDWFVYITDAPRRDIVFDRPEVMNIETQSVQVGDVEGEYAEGEWEVRLAGLGSVTPFALIQNDFYDDTIPFQWLRWGAGDNMREFAVFNGCSEISQAIRPCYSRDELVDLAASLIFTPPDFAQRRVAQQRAAQDNGTPITVRAYMGATAEYALEVTEYSTGYPIYSPRHIKYIPYNYHFSGMGYLTDIEVVWQVFSRTLIENIRTVGLNYIQTDITTPVILIMQQQTTDPIEGLLSGCDTPSNATSDVIRLGNGGALLTRGTWEAGAESFAVHAGFCIEGQTFLALRWIEGPNTFEIMAIDAEGEVDIDVLMSIADSMEP